MALWNQYFLCLLYILLLHPLRNNAFDTIYQFGDSVSDTGNDIREIAASCSARPYGETLFLPPTGRCSDGFLIVDFLAKAFGIPFLNPYLERDANFVHGVNFAVSGSTALDISFLELLGITGFLTSSSLSVQLGWFKTHLKSNNICSSKEECKYRFGRTLFIVGPIGNDYTYAVTSGQNGYDLVPDVIQIIREAINEVVDNGASHVVVPGYFNLGCYPSVLSNISMTSNDASLYDEFNCFKATNEFIMYHNLKLQEAINELQLQHPSVSISYGDLYSAFTWILQNAASLGIEKDELLKTCCGEGNNAYNFDINRYCGTPGVPSCPDPTKRVFWDGIHLTQQAYNYMANWLLEHTFKAI